MQDMQTGRVIIQCEEEAVKFFALQSQKITLLERNNMRIQH
jgi:hypothetical protein